MNTQTLSQTSRPFTSPEQEAHDQVALQGALSALLTLAVTWVRPTASSPSQGHWEDSQRALDDGGEL